MTIIEALTHPDFVSGRKVMSKVYDSPRLFCTIWVSQLGRTTFSDHDIRSEWNLIERSSLDKKDSHE